MIAMMTVSRSFFDLIDDARDLLGPVADRSDVSPEYQRAVLELVATLTLGTNAGQDYLADLLDVEPDVGSQPPAPVTVLTENAINALGEAYSVISRLERRQPIQPSEINSALCSIEQTGVVRPSTGPGTLTSDLPAGYRWATPTETQENPPGAIVVPRTVDSSGRPYSEGEADIAVPLHPEGTATTTDQLALDAIATLLGTSPEWSSAADFLSDIANLVGATERPHPGDQDPAEYVETFRSITGRNVPEAWSRVELDGDRCQEPDCTDPDCDGQGHIHDYDAATGSYKN